MLNPWILLFIAIAFEVVGTSFLKWSAGFQKPFIGLVVLGCYSVSIFLMSKASQVLPISVTYPIWSGIGILAITAIGTLYFGESMNGIKLFCIGLIMVGTAGLYWV